MEKTEKETRGDVADAVLQTEKDVVIGARTYRVAPPTTATLIMVSRLIPQLPAEEPDGDNVLAWVLGNARHYGMIGDILAVLVLGAKRCREGGGKSLRWLKKGRKRHITEQEELAEYILEETSPSEQVALMTELIGRMQVASFFGLTTFLSGLNILKVTKGEVGK